jgi:hypothetical protein
MNINRSFGLLAIAVLLMAMLPAFALAFEPVCHACGKKIIQGEWIEVDGKYFHKSCFKCHICGKPISGEVRKDKDGNYYHRQCYEEHKSIWCAICGEEIFGEYFRDYWGNAYCAHHRDQVPKCDYCGRYITEKSSKGGFEYEDGRIICGICLESAVSEVSQVNTILTEIIDSLATIGIAIDTGHIAGLRLVGQDELTRLAHGSEAAGWAECRVEKSADGTERDCRCTISLLNDTPHYHFICALAHELMHVWLAANTSGAHHPVLAEGSCNYAAHLILKKYDAPEARYMIEAMTQMKHAAYRAGLSVVKKFAEENGHDYWLEYLKTSSKLPD